MNNKFRFSGDTCIIEMNSYRLGKIETFVDAADYDRIKSFKWSPVRKKKKLYVRTSIQFFNNGVISKSSISLHRLIASFPDSLVDHADGNGLNNKSLNLRNATVQENNRNSSVRSTNKLGVKGVRLDKNSGKYRSTIKVNKRSLHLGLFNSIQDASNAYDKAAKELFKEFSRPNFWGHMEIL